MTFLTFWSGTYFQSTENEYTQATQGLAWVTFDSTSSTKGTATPRIFVGTFYNWQLVISYLTFVGVIDKGTNVYKSEDGGATCKFDIPAKVFRANIHMGSAVAGQPSFGFIPHKGVLSPTEKLLYVSYSDGGGPYDGLNGTVHKYDITTGSWTDISPVPHSTDSSFGYGGLTVDLQKPGTLMVAALNQWWPDATIWRSTNSGATWSPIWYVHRYWPGHDLANHY